MRQFRLDSIDLSNRGKYRQQQPKKHKSPKYKASEAKRIKELAEDDEYSDPFRKNRKDTSTKRSFF